MTDTTNPYNSNLTPGSNQETAHGPTHNPAHSSAPFTRDISSLIPGADETSNPTIMPDPDSIPWPSRPRRSDNHSRLLSAESAAGPIVIAQLPSQRRRSNNHLRLNGPDTELFVSARIPGVTGPGEAISASSAQFLDRLLEAVPTTNTSPFSFSLDRSNSSEVTHPSDSPRADADEVPLEEIFGLLAAEDPSSTEDLMRNHLVCKDKPPQDYPFM